MTGTAILLIAVSSFTHAGWNLLGKSTRSTSASFMIANLAGAGLLLPAAAVLSPLVIHMPLRVWLFLAATGAFQALYYVSLSSAYLKGDMSVAYPLVRALPILFVTLTGYLLGTAISPIALAGFAAVVVGALLLPLRSLRGGSLGIYRQANLLFAVFAAAGTAGYSMIDSAALHLFRTALTSFAPSSGWQVAIPYSFFEALASSAWLAIFLAFGSRGRRWIKEAVRPAQLRRALVMGVGIYLTYTLVLISMGFVANVGYVVAFRQLSIPIGVLLGIAVLREPAYLPKLAGTAIMVAGLVVTAIG